MTKEQVLNQFWNSFDLPAYDENTVPDEVEMPYITYSVSIDSLDEPVLLYASLWYEGMGWKDISNKSTEIAKYITEQIPPAIPYDGGRLYITKGTPFAQRMNEPGNINIRRMLISIQAEFMSSY